MPVERHIRAYGGITHYALYKFMTNYLLNKRWDLQEQDQNWVFKSKTKHIDSRALGVSRPVTQVSRTLSMPMW